MQPLRNRKSPKPAGRLSSGATKRHSCPPARELTRPTTLPKTVGRLGSGATKRHSCPAAREPTRPTKAPENCRAPGFRRHGKQHSCPAAREPTRPTKAPETVGRLGSGATKRHSCPAAREPTRPTKAPENCRAPGFRRRENEDIQARRRPAGKGLRKPFRTICGAGWGIPAAGGFREDLLFCPACQSRPSLRLESHPEF